jgi:hypothetical protein
MYEQWLPSILSPFRAEASIDAGEEGTAKVAVDSGTVILHANDGKIYLELDEVVRIMQLLGEALELCARYDAEEPDMITGVEWRAWRRAQLHPEPRHAVDGPALAASYAGERTPPGKHEFRYMTDPYVDDALKGTLP